MSNKVQHFFPQTQCKDHLGFKVSILCPDFDSICPPRNLDCDRGIAYQEENDFVFQPYIAPNSSLFVPYNILFLYDQNITKINRNLLEQAGKDVNKHLASFLKAPSLTEVRRARKWNSKLIDFIGSVPRNKEAIKQIIGLFREPHKTKLV